jgi:hypothetical protein
MSKIVYSNRPLRKGERRATMKEAVDANRICYWGTHKVDPRIIGNKQMKVKERRKLASQVSSCKKRLVTLENKVSNAKNQKSKEKLEDKLNALHVRCTALMNAYKGGNVAMQKIKQVAEKITSKPATANKQISKSTEKRIESLEKEINKVEQILEDKISEIKEKQMELEQENVEISKGDDAAKDKRFAALLINELLEENPEIKSYNELLANKIVKDIDQLTADLEAGLDDDEWEDPEDVQQALNLTEKNKNRYYKMVEDWKTITKDQKDVVIKELKKARNKLVELGVSFDVPDELLMEVAKTEKFIMK